MCHEDFKSRYSCTSFGYSHDCRSVKLCQKQAWIAGAFTDSVRMFVRLWRTFEETDYPDANLLARSIWRSEAEERAKKEAEEQAQQEVAMEPQEVQTEAEQSKPKGDTLAGDGSESAEGGRARDGTAGDTKQESQDGRDEKPPLQNGTTPSSVGKDAHVTCTNVTWRHKDGRKKYVVLQLLSNHGQMFIRNRNIISRFLEILMSSKCPTCVEEQNKSICHWTGELCEDAETPETEDTKSKEVEGELVCLVFCRPMPLTSVTIYLFFQ